MKKTFISYRWCRTRIIIIVIHKQIQKAHVFYFQEGEKHEIDFSSPLVEGRKNISNQAPRLQLFLINLLRHLLKPTDVIFCCNRHAGVSKHRLFVSEDDFLLLQSRVCVSGHACASDAHVPPPSGDLLKSRGRGMQWNTGCETKDEMSSREVRGGTQSAVDSTHGIHVIFIYKAPLTIKFVSRHFSEIQDRTRNQQQRQVNKTPFNRKKPPTGRNHATVI